MAKAIKLKPYEGPVDVLASRFFGDPVLPEAWLEELTEDVFFFCQIALSDLAEWDLDGVFPHSGYLYIFLDTSEGEYSLKPIVRYLDGEPDIVVGEFNKVVVGFEEYTQVIGITFEACEIDEDCTRLLGLPSDWNYEEESPHLLLQIDHMDEGIDFLPHLDGFTYLFFGKDLETFSDVQIYQEYS